MNNIKTIYITYSRNSGKKWILDEVFSSMNKLDKFYLFKKNYIKCKNNVFKRYCGTEFLKIIKQGIQL